MMRARMFYRALMYCYPAAFRHEYGNQMFMMFAEQLRHARGSGKRHEQIALWLGAALDVLVIAPREHGHVIAQDLRYAFRTMGAKPSFTLVAILSLALGIGGNTAIFSLWNNVLHSSLPGVHKPEELVMLSDPNRSGGWTGQWDGRTDGPRAWLTYSEYEQLRDHADSFSSMMAAQSSLSTWQIRFDGGSIEEAHGRLVSGGFFHTLGVNPLIGRLFTQDHDNLETPEAVVSYSYWQQRFGGSLQVLGRTFALRKGLITIVGVTPPGFIGENAGQQPDLWLPLRLQPIVIPGRDRLHDTPPDKSMWLQVFGRLKPGVTPAQAEAQANALFQSSLQMFYGESLFSHPELLEQRLQLQSAALGASDVRGEFARSLTALLGAVGILLLIACANIANLLLAHGAARKPEIALRLSLGANRGRLIRQLVTESLALAGLGGIAAIAVAYGLHGSLVRMIAESDSDFALAFNLDSALLSFVVLATLAAALLCGLLPAWQATKTDVETGLRQQRSGRLRSGRFLVSAQLALSLPLLVGAGLLARTVYNLRHADVGYPADHLLLARVDMSEGDYEVGPRVNLINGLLGELRQIPGVRAVSFSQLGLFTGGNSSGTVEVEAYVPKSETDNNSGFDRVGAGYFSSLGSPLIGRDILESDRLERPYVCVINEAFAKHYFAQRNPIGMHVTAVEADDSRRTYEVVGVAKNARTQNLREEVAPRYFVPAAQLPSPTFLIRSATDAASILQVVRDTIRKTDPALPILSVKTTEERIAPLIAQDGATAKLVVVFGIVALTLAAIGLYGVLSYGVAHRTREMAIRMAVGARPFRVIAMILGETSRLMVAGLALGGGLAYVASNWINTRLYGVAPADPLTFAWSTALLVAVALVAAYLPARRASKLDPMTALRRE